MVISFVEHMLAAKDKLIKGKRQDGGAFSDDGFALGRFRVTQYAIYMYTYTHTLIKGKRQDGGAFSDDDGFALGRFRV